MRYLVLLAIFATTSCTTVIHGVAPETLSESEGYLLISTGRDNEACDECGVGFLNSIPWVKWWIVEQASGNRVAAINPDLGGLSGDLDDGYYGYTHIETLPAGNYALMGEAGFIVGVTPGWILPAFEFSISEGKITYIGEFITMDATLNHDSIRHRNMINRDLRTITNRYPFLSSYEYTSVTPTRRTLKLENPGGRTRSPKREGGT